MSEERHHVDHSKSLTHLSLCTGYGGIDLGLKRALRDVRTVAYVEVEAFACENLVTKVEAGLLDAAPIWTNLKTFPWESFRGRVDILSGGFPCQPFSSAGRRAGDSDPRHLWPYIADGVRRLGNPPVIFLENVEGIISSKLTGSDWVDPEGTPVLLHVLRELERLGYKATAKVFSAAEVSAPHQRKRVFIMGCHFNLSSEGRGIADGMLRETGRGQELANAEHDDSPHCHTGYASQATKERKADRTQRLSHYQHVWPASRGADQHPWEPARVTMGNFDRKRSQGDVSEMESRGRGQTDQKPSTRSSAQRNLQWQAERTLGRATNGAPSGMGYAELCHAMDNRIDELRLLGNGVVPATAERAFRVLWRDLRGNPQ